MARPLYAAAPADSWNVKALAWTLHSAFKLEPDETRKTALVREFLALPEMPEDELLSNVRKSLLRLADPARAPLAAAYEASKEGNIGQAITLLREVLHDNPGHERAETALAWELFKSIQAELKLEQPDPERIGGRVNEYVLLERVEKPGVIHSRMLQVAARAARKKAFPRFCEFLKWWDPARNLREEDYQGGPKPDGGFFDGTVEAAISAVGKTIAGCEDEGARRIAADFVEAHADKYPGQEWFSYYRAACKLAKGEIQEAKVMLIPIVRAKMGEYWAWQKLASCYERGSEKQVQCLCRAATCPVKDDEFLLGVFVELGRLLLETEHAPAGRQLLEKACAIKSGKGWRISGPLQMAMEGSEGVLAVDSAPLLKEWAKQADEILLGDLPWSRAVVSGLNVELGRDGEKRNFHFLKAVAAGAPNGMRDCRVPANKSFRFLETLSAGAPVSVRLDLSGDYPRVLSVQSRLEGEPWDICPVCAGAVERVNADKRLAVVRLRDGRTCPVHFDSCPEARTWISGVALECRWSERDDRIRIHFAKAVAGAAQPPVPVPVDEEVPF